MRIDVDENDSDEEEEEEDLELPVTDTVRRGRLRTPVMKYTAAVGSGGARRGTLPSPSHATESSADGKRTVCVLCNNRRAVYGNAVDRVALRCTKCRLGTDLNVVDSMCAVCKIKHPSFGPNGSKIRCGDCRLSTDVSAKLHKNKGPSMLVDKPSSPPIVVTPISPPSIPTKLSATAAICNVCKLKVATFGPVGSSMRLRCGKCRLESDFCFLKKRACVSCGKKTASFGPSDREGTIPAATSSSALKKIGRKILRCADCKLPTDVNLNRCYSNSKRNEED